MLKIAIAIAWLGCVNLQNLAQTMPTDGIWVGICGSSHRLWVPLSSGRKQPGRECASGCHAAHRKAGLAETGDDG